VGLVWGTECAEEEGYPKECDSGTESAAGDAAEAREASPKSDGRAGCDSPKAYQHQQKWYVHAVCYRTRTECGWDGGTRVWSRANTTKTAAKAALRRKKQHEHTLDQTTAQVATLEQQIYSIEAANINRETLEAMAKAGEAMKQIHGKLNIDKVDETMYVSWLVHTCKADRSY